MMTPGYSRQVSGDEVDPCPSTSPRLPQLPHPLAEPRPQAVPHPLAETHTAGPGGSSCQEVEEQGRLEQDKRAIYK